MSEKFKKSSKQFYLNKIGTKNCIICKNPLPYHRNKYCSKKCYWKGDPSKESKKKYKIKNKEKIKERTKIWTEKNKEKLQLKRFNIKIGALRKIQKDKNITDLKCSNCNCKDIRILEINHINGNGHEEKKRNYIHYKILSGDRNTDDLEITCKLCNIAHFIKLKYGIEYEIKLKHKLNNTS